MTKQISLKISQEEAQIVKEILVQHQEGYSKEFPPERIVSVRDVIKKLED
jgi:hypothetical protein